MQKKKLRRFVNRRPACFGALALICGILIGEPLSFVNPLFRLIPLIIFAILFFVVFYYKHTRKYSYIFVMLIVGIIAVSAQSDLYSKSLFHEEKSVYIQASIASEIIVEEIDGEDVMRFKVGDMYVGNQKITGKANVVMYADFEPEFNAGDVIELYGYINAKPHEMFGSYYVNAVSTNVHHNIYAFKVQKIAEAEPNFLLKLQMKIKSMLYNNTDEYTASICQALLIGDKTGIDKGLYEDIKVSGVAHVLAVSGLHITVVAGLLYFVLKKLRINPKIALVLVTAALFFYMMLCSFTASSLRALIMSVVFAAGSAFHKKKDNLSSMGVAAIIILLFRPTEIMSAGFLLSFGAVLGILMFAKPFTNLGMRGVKLISPKHSFGKRIVEMSSVTLSANLLTYPMTGYFFGQVQTLFMLTNLIIVPYIMFTHIILLIITVFALISGIGGVFAIMQYLLMPFKAVVGFVGSLSFASVPVIVPLVLIISTAIIMLILSHNIFFTKRQKIISVLSVLSLSLVIISVPLM